MDIANVINQIWKKLFSAKALKSLLVVIILIFIGSLWHSLIYADDSWFGEQSYWFAKCGYPKATTMKDFLAIDKHLFVYHKLNIFLGAIVVKLFGFSVYYFKLLTLFIYVYFFRVYYQFYKNSLAFADKKAYLIAATFLFANPLMISLSFSFRPEILVMFFGFLSYYNLDDYLRLNKSSSITYSGIFAGLAFLSHPNGIIFSIATFLVLLINKKIKAVLLFGLFSSLIASLFLYDLYQPGHLQSYLFQLHNWPDNVGSNYNELGIKSVLLKLVNEQQRFFWSTRVMAFSILFLLCFIFYFRYLINLNKTLVIYLISLIIALNLFGSQIAERYLIYFFPYFGMVIATIILKLNQENKIIFKTIFIIVCSLQLFFCGQMFAFIYSRNNNYPAIHHQVLSNIPDKKALTLVPNEYVFNELETRNLVVYKIFEYYQKEHGAFTQETFFKRAHELDIKYIVIGKRILTHDDITFPFFINQPITQNPYYVVQNLTSEYIILKWKN